MKGRGLLTLAILLVSFGLWAQKAQNEFCVSSKDFESFKARVAFNSLDFGRSAARQMVYNKEQKHLGTSIQISANLATCACADSCALLEVSATDWDGHMSENGLSTSTVLGTAAEVTDKMLTEAKKLWSNPEGFLQNVLSSPGKGLKARKT